MDFQKLTYTFESGKTYAVVGPNGSGKSTLLQVLWGQLPPSNGKMIYQFSGSIIQQEEIFRHLAIATPYMDLIEEFTLEEMLKFHFKFKKIREGKTVSGLMEMMELSSSRTKQISNFSSGMRQRLKLALAFYSDASMVFLDEPTTNLDKKSIDWYLTNLASISGNTLVFIASNQEHEYPSNSKKIQIQDFK